MLIAFFVLEERKSGELELSFPSDQRLLSPPLRVKDSVSVLPVRGMALQQRAVQVSLRNVTPSIPEAGQERVQLEEDLKKMRCAGLLERLWGLKHKEIVRELLIE